LLKETIMNALHAKLIALTLTACSAAVGQSLAAGDREQVATRNGEHPAVIQARLAARAGYDYASKFYPHPAWLALLPEAPHELGQHPAVIVASTWKNRGYDYASKFYPHPAWLALLPEAPHELGDHPAVIVAREAARAARTCTECRPAPANDRLAAKAQ